MVKYADWQQTAFDTTTQKVKVRGMFTPEALLYIVNTANKERELFKSAKALAEELKINVQAVYKWRKIARETPKVFEAELQARYEKITALTQKKAKKKTLKKAVDMTRPLSLEEFMQHKLTNGYLSNSGVAAVMTAIKMDEPVPVIAKRFSIAPSTVNSVGELMKLPAAKLTQKLALREKFASYAALEESMYETSSLDPNVVRENLRENGLQISVAACEKGIRILATNRAIQLSKRPIKTFPEFKETLSFIDQVFKKGYLNEKLVNTIGENLTEQIPSLAKFEAELKHKDNSTFVLKMRNVLDAIGRDYTNAPDPEALNRKTVLLNADGKKGLLPLTRDQRTAFKTARHEISQVERSEKSHATNAFAKFRTALTQYPHKLRERALLGYVQSFVEVSVRDTAPKGDPYLKKYTITRPDMTAQSISKTHDRIFAKRFQMEVGTPEMEIDASKAAREYLVSFMEKMASEPVDNLQGLRCLQALNSCQPEKLSTKHKERINTAMQTLAKQANEFETPHDAFNKMVRKATLNALNELGKVKDLENADLLCESLKTVTDKVLELPSKAMQSLRNLKTAIESRAKKSGKEMYARVMPQPMQRAVMAFTTFFSNHSISK